MRADDCIRAVIEASGGKLTEDEAEAIFERIQQRAAAERAAGKLDGLTERVAQIAREEGDRLRLAAAKAKQHAALNAIRRDELETQIETGLAAGLDARQIELGILEGSTQGVAGARVSVAATFLGYVRRYAHSMLEQIKREQPHLFNRRALADKRLSDDTIREMRELREGGQPGVTGNADAQYLAKTFAAHAELSRTDLNRLGAFIGKLDGWSPQVHDANRIMRVKREDWVREISGRLDWERTMPEVLPGERGAVLERMYDDIVTGVDRAENAASRGEFQGPANIANRLGRERVLHFKTAEDAITYNDRFGFGNVFAAIWKHQESAARYAAQMRVLGPNPETMMRSIADRLEKRTAADERLSPAKRGQIAKQLRIDGDGPVASAWRVVTGMHMTTANAVASDIGTGVRAAVSVAKLGGSMISSIADLVSAAANLGFHGNRSYLGALATQVSRLVTEGRGRGSQREWALAVGESGESVVGHVNSHYYAGDGAPGLATRALDFFFRWNGQTWWTEANRSVTARVMSAEMGHHAGKAYGALPERYRHVLGLHGIEERHWEALRQANFKLQENGRPYVTPDRVRALPDSAIEPLVDGKVTPGRIEDARRDLEIAVRRFFADEARFALIEPDAAVQRWTTGGMQRGSFWGEAARTVMQFKAYPIGFTQRVIGRAMHGAEDRGNAGAAHIGTLIVGSMVAGYIAMTAKDVLRNRTPREMSSETFIAAMLQGGGLGIYGDFLFGQSNSFGNSAVETLAGPTAGAVGSVVNLWQKARAGDATAGQALNTILQNTPFINLFYARPVLDALILNAMHEHAQPGWLARQRETRRREYGQQPIFQ